VVAHEPDEGRDGARARTLDGTEHGLGRQGGARDGGGGRHSRQSQSITFE